MKRNSKFIRSIFIFIGLFAIVISLNAQEIKNEGTALILIDIQNFYFQGGKFELVNPEEASKNAAEILGDFREQEILVVHIRHNLEPGGEIHENVKPKEGEMVITKNEVNAFNSTNLQSFLEERQIKNLVLVGMQTHMCLEGTTRAAYDLGFNCIVIGDACATRNLEYKDHSINADDVHYSTLKTLESYAKVMSTVQYLTENKK